MTKLRTIAQALALTEISGIAVGRVRTLADDFGGIESITEVDPSELTEYHFISSEDAELILNNETEVANWEGRLEEYQKSGIELVFFESEQYPSRLNAIGGPLLLYCRGDVSLLHAGGVGFTGTREASDDAVSWTQDVASNLASHEVIISGGAEGVDTAAHEGAIQSSGKTIVVFGTGLNVPYPKSNEELFEHIASTGGLLISRRPPDAQPTRAGFLNRNKTLSGLSDAVTVVATDGSGGTMSTYRAAKSQGRQIYCPDPQLELEPYAGIKQIADDAAIPIRRAAEILAYQESETAESSTSTDDVVEDGQDPQQNLDEFSN